MHGTENENAALRFEHLENRQLLSTTTEAIGLTIAAAPSAPAGPTMQAAPPPIVVSGKSATTSAAPVQRIPVLGGTTAQQSGPVRVVTASASTPERVGAASVATGFKVFDATWGG